MMSIAKPTRQIVTDVAICRIAGSGRWTVSTLPAFNGDNREHQVAEGIAASPDAAEAAALSAAGAAIQAV